MPLRCENSFVNQKKKKKKKKKLIFILKDEGVKAGVLPVVEGNEKSVAKVGYNPFSFHFDALTLDYTLFLLFSLVISGGSSC